MHYNCHFTQFLQPGVDRPSLTLQTRASLRAVATKNCFLASAAHDLRQLVHALSLWRPIGWAEPEMARDTSPRILQSTRAINELSICCST
jgi:hypothetical protein